MQSSDFRSRVEGKNGNGPVAVRSITPIIIKDGDEVTIQEFIYADDGVHRRKDKPFTLIADSKSPNRLARMLPTKKQGESFFSRPPANGEERTKIPFYRLERVQSPNSLIQVSMTSLALNLQR